MVLNKNFPNKNRRDGRVGYGGKHWPTSYDLYRTNVVSSQVKVQLNIISWSRKWRGFESHSRQSAFLPFFGLFLEYIRVSGLIDIFLL